MDSKGPNIFQTILMFVFGVIAVVALLIFSGILPGFRADKMATSEIPVLWGVIPNADFTRLVSDYNEKNKEMPLAVKYQYHDPARFDDELTRALASGTGPDMFMVTNENFFRHLGEIYKISFTAYPESNFKNAFLDSGEVFQGKDGFYALPFGIDPLVMYYNRSTFSGAGLALPPDSWPAVVANHQIITKVDNRKNIQKSLVALGEFSNIRNAKEIFVSMIFQAGNPIVSLGPDGKHRSILGNSFGYSPDPLTAATTFFAQFSDPLKTTYSWNRSMPMDIDNFVAGDLALYFGFASELAALRDKNPHLDFNVAGFPQKDAQGKAYAKIYAIALTKNSTKLTSAWTALQVLSGSNMAPLLDNALDIVPMRRSLISTKPTDPMLQVFYKSAIMAKSFADPDYISSKGVLNDVIERYKSGVVVSAAGAGNNLSVLLNQP